MADGAAGFPQGVSDPAVLRNLLGQWYLRVRSSHALWPGFPPGSTSLHCNPIAVLQPRTCRNMSGLGSSPFARHYSGNHCYFLLLRLLRCFSSARSRILQHTFSMLGCPIRKSPDRFLFADTRCLSQLITSFFASGSLGIPRVPLFTFFSLYPFAHIGMLMRCARPVPRRTRKTAHLPLSSLVFFLPICQRTPVSLKHKAQSSKASRTNCPPLYASRSNALRSLVENNGFEPLTPCVQGRCSSQLS